MVDYYEVRKFLRGCQEVWNVNYYTELHGGGTEILREILIYYLHQSYTGYQSYFSRSRTLNIFWRIAFVPPL